MSEPKMFPLQTSRHAPPGPVMIPWSVAEIAYGAYAALYGKGQSLERIAERGGFSWCEMDDFHPKWRDEVSQIAALTAENERLRGALERIEGILDQNDWLERNEIRKHHAMVREALGVCNAIGPHHGDKCDGGRVQSPNAQFTQDCKACGGTGLAKGVK